MSEKIKIAVFSPNDPKPWVRKKNIDLMLEHESCLIRVPRDRNVEVIRGREGESKQDQLAWNTSLVRDISRESQKKVLMH